MALLLNRGDAVVVTWHGHSPLYCTLTSCPPLLLLIQPTDAKVCYSHLPMSELVSMLTEVFGGAGFVPVVKASPPVLLENFDSKALIPPAHAGIHLAPVAMRHQWQHCGPARICRRDLGVEKVGGEPCLVWVSPPFLCVNLWVKVKRLVICNPYHLTFVTHVTKVQPCVAHMPGSRQVGAHIRCLLCSTLLYQVASRSSYANCTTADQQGNSFWRRSVSFFAIVCFYKYIMNRYILSCVRYMRFLHECVDVQKPWHQKQEPTCK